MNPNVCECGCNIPKGFDKIHRKTKKHEIYLKYKDIIINNKITCEKCNVALSPLYYELHALSDYHINGVQDKIRCECNKIVNKHFLSMHLESNTHIKKMNIKNNTRLQEKIANYEANMNLSNCCSICYKTNILDKYYIPNINACLCCDEISKDNIKRCMTCKQDININFFERPYLIRCRPCAALRIKKLIHNQRADKTLKLKKDNEFNEIFPFTKYPKLESNQEHQLSNSNPILNEVTIFPNIHTSSFIKTPEFMRYKKSILNIENNDNYCFIWCILASLYPVTSLNHSYRVTKYKKYINKINFIDLVFPMKIDDIHKFEELNSISINVFGYNYESNKESYYPIYLSKYSYPKTIELLYIENSERYHYILIKHFNRLVSVAINNIGNNNKVFNICRKCITAYYSENSFNKHKIFCVTKKNLNY